MAWDPLEGELSEKLDKCPYVSLSHDRKLQLAESNKPHDDIVPEGAEEKADEEITDEEMSLFDIHMPGVMTAEEVLSEIDLDHWLLLVHGNFVHMSVRNRRITLPFSLQTMLLEEGKE
jgi:arginine-tRNA-protein transferase